MIELRIRFFEGGRLAVVKHRGRPSDFSQSIEKRLSDLCC